MAQVQLQQTLPGLAPTVRNVDLDGCFQSESLAEDGLAEYAASLEPLSADCKKPLTVTLVGPLVHSSLRRTLLGSVRIAEDVCLAQAVAALAHDHLLSFHF